MSQFCCQYDPDTLPIFVARDLGKLPSIDFNTRIYYLYLAKSNCENANRGTFQTSRRLTLRISKQMSTLVSTLSPVLQSSTSGTSLVVNELLTYVFDAHKNHPAETIKQNVLNFYSSTAIHDAKLALWNAYERHLSKLTTWSQPEHQRICRHTRIYRRLRDCFFNADTLPVLFVAVNLRNLPREQRKDVIEDILSRLKRIEMREACVPATAPTTAPATAPATVISATYADAAKSRRTDTASPVVLQPNDVRKRRANEHMPPVCDDSRNTPRHVTSSLFPEAMRYDGEGFAIPPEHAKKARRREMRERRDDRSAREKESQKVHDRHTHICETDERAKTIRITDTSYRESANLEEDITGNIVLSTTVHCSSWNRRVAGNSGKSSWHLWQYRLRTMTFFGSTYMCQKWKLRHTYRHRARMNPLKLSASINKILDEVRCVVRDERWCPTDCSILYNLYFSSTWPSWHLGPYWPNSPAPEG